MIGKEQNHSTEAEMWSTEQKGFLHWILYFGE